MHAFPRSSVLVLEDNLAASSLIPSTLIDQVDALLDSHKIDDAAALVDQRRKKLEGNLTVDPDEAEELDYVYQVIGFKCFSETLFEDAGRNLFNGKLDPRVLVSYFPDLRGRLFEDGDQVDVFAGAAERMPAAKSIEELIHLNLVLNYSPHLSPTSPPTLELTRVLNEAAREMLLVFLEKSRKRARVERRAEDLAAEVTRVVDTVLVKLYCRFSRQTALLSLLAPTDIPKESDEPPNNIILSEVEPIFRAQSLFLPLAQLYKQYKQEEKLLNLYAFSAEDTRSSSETKVAISDPVGGIFDLLSGRKGSDRKGCVKWGLWMLRRGEIERGMKLLIPPEPSKRRDKDRDKDKESDFELLEQISSANEGAGRRFLEYLVLIKRHPSPVLHTRLASACVGDLLRCIQDESVSKLWRAKVSSYASPRASRSHLHTSPPPPSSPQASVSHSQTTISPSSSPPQSQCSAQTHLPSPPLRSLKQPTSVLSASSLSSKPETQPQFLTYFSSTTPDSSSKRTRLKAIFMLSGSGLYDARAVLNLLLAETPEYPGDSGDTETHKASGGGRGIESVLALECAILYGKLGDHAKALSILVHTLRDSNSAEAYCTLGGEVVPVKVAWDIAETSSPSVSSKMDNALTEIGLREWYFGLFELPQVSAKAGRRGTPGTAGNAAGARGPAAAEAADAPAVIRQKSVKEEEKKALLTDLVSVYMRAGDVTSSIERTTKLLESQGVNLDVVDVVTRVPDTWPLKSVHTFLARFFRRTLHTSYENMILKNLSAGQNMLVRDRSWPILREHGYMIEEPDSEDESHPFDAVVDEKVAQLQTEEAVEKLMPLVLEKAHHQEQDVEDAVDIRIRPELGEGVEGGIVGEERSALGLMLDEGGAVAVTESDGGNNQEYEGNREEREENFTYTGEDTVGKEEEKEREEDEEESFVYEHGEDLSTDCHGEDENQGIS